MTKKLFASFAFATMMALAAPMSSEPAKAEVPAAQAAAAPATLPSLDAAMLRIAARMIYNAHSIDLDKPLSADSVRALVKTPEPNANLMIGCGLLGLAYLLQKKGKKSQQAPR
jgi:hypothetical protein